MHVLNEEGIQIYSRMQMTYTYDNFQKNKDVKFTLHNVFYILQYKMSNYTLQVDALFTLSLLASVLLKRFL